MKPILLLLGLLLSTLLLAETGPPWLAIESRSGIGAGKNIVLVSGDEEYRSEESFPMLARILALRHGFKCTVLFAINKQTGEIDPNTIDNIPGLEALATADLMVICTRFRELPDEQMKHVDAYLEAGKPVVGVRPAVVAFRNAPESRFFKYSSNNPGPDFASEGFRRMTVNACFWAVGLEDKIPAKTDVEFVGPYEPTVFGFDQFRKGMPPAKLLAQAIQEMNSGASPK